MTSEKDLLELALITNKVKPLSFLDALQHKNLTTKNTFQNTASTVAILNPRINKPKIKHPSFFAAAENITALRREHSRIRQSNDKSANLVSVGLHILDNIVCLQNPSNLDVDHMHKLALAFFKQADRANNSFGTYLTGVANVYGYCGPANIPNGFQQIKAAAERKCAEAQQFLGLYSARCNFIMYACRMFRAAALGGHPLAPINFKRTQELLQKQIRKARLLAKHQTRLKRRRALKAVPAM